jgi:hypothetical protein
VVAARRGGAAWHFFVLGGGVLADIDDGSRAGLHVYAEHPLLQIGPLALAAAWGLGRLANGYSLLAAQLLGTGLGAGVILLVRRIALRAGTLRGQLAGPVPTGKLLVASACFVPVWLYAAVASVHLDDVLALTFGLSALALVQSGRPVWAGLAVAAAVDCKPWALPLGVVLLALAPRRTRAVGVGVAALGMAAGWLPFFLTDPQTVRALHYTIVNTALSGLRVLHVNSARTPPWDRPLQALVGLALGVAALRRGRLTGVPLLVMASRVALDPGTNRYYTAGLAAGALLWDLTGSRRRRPWWSLTVLPGLHLARWLPALDPLHGPAVVAFAVAAAASVLLGRTDQGRGRANVHDPVPEPDRPQPPGEVSAARRSFDVLDLGRRQQGRELGEGAVHEDPTPVQDRDAMAANGGLVVMGRACNLDPASRSSLEPSGSAVPGAQVGLARNSLSRERPRVVEPTGAQHARAPRPPATDRRTVGRLPCGDRRRP